MANALAFEDCELKEIYTQINERLPGDGIL